MLNKKNLLAVLVLLISALGMAKAQINKNAIYGNFGGAYQLGAGLHYERILAGGEYLHLSAGAGLGQSFNKSTESLAGGTYLPTNIALAAGFKGHFIEVAAGPLARLSVGMQEGLKVYAEPSLVGGQLQVGYKFIAQNKPGLFLKVYASGLFLSANTASDLSGLEAWAKGTFQAKMLPSAGISLGLSF